MTFLNEVCPVVPYPTFPVPHWSLPTRLSSSVMSHGLPSVFPHHLWPSSWTPFQTFRLHSYLHIYMYTYRQDLDIQENMRFWFSESRWPHLILYFPDSSIVFFTNFVIHFPLQLNNIPLCPCTTFHYPPICWWVLRGFRFPAITMLIHMDNITRMCKCLCGGQRVLWVCSQEWYSWNPRSCIEQSAFSNKQVARKTNETERESTYWKNKDRKLRTNGPFADPTGTSQLLEKEKECMKQSEMLVPMPWGGTCGDGDMGRF